MNKTTARQIETALKLIEPMGSMIEVMHQVIIAHHPEAVDADDCPVCSRYSEPMGEILERWSDVRAQVTEHWDV